MNGRPLSGFRLQDRTVSKVEGFRAPAGVLNPDEYDPRIVRLAEQGKDPAHRNDEHDQSDHPSLDINARFLALVRVALIL